jgi:hypothetical protein
VPAAAACDVPPLAADHGTHRVWIPHPWREESRRTDLHRVGRFDHERALRRPELEMSAGAHHVASVLASYGDEHGRNIFPSQQTLAKVCRRSARHVRAKLRELTELGLVRRLSHGGGRPSYRDGGRRRVTSARYELTLPAWLADDADTRTAGIDDGDTNPSQPGTGGGRPDARPPAATPVDPGEPAAHDAGKTAKAGELSPHTVDQIRAAIGATALSDQQARAAVDAAVARAPGRVTDRVAYALAVIRSDPAAFRPTPDVTGPPCPLHRKHPATRCPECAAARSDPPPTWRQMRARLRQARAP